MGTDVPLISYTAQGAEITLESTDTLQDVRTKINAATYAAGNGIQASIIDNQLILSAGRVGYDIEHGGALLGPSGLRLLDAGGAWSQTLQESSAASLKVNGIPVTRYSNTGLTDVIAGVTLNLMKATETGEKVTLSISDDNGAVTNQINAFVNRFNDLTGYLASKTAVTQNADGKTYTRAALAGDTVFETLRLSLISDLIKSQSGLSATAPSSLRQIGLTFNDELKLSVSNTSALQAALSSDRAGVAELLDRVFSETSGVLHRLGVFTGMSGGEGIMSKSIARLDAEKQTLSGRISEMEERLTAQEQLLTSKYSTILSQLAEMQSQQSYLAGLYSSLNSWG
jgi:flagellar hook-associated protein 2